LRVKSLSLTFFSSFKIYFPKKNLLLGIIVQENWIVADSGGRIAAGQRRAGVPPSLPFSLAPPIAPVVVGQPAPSLPLAVLLLLVVVGGKRGTESDRRRETGGHGNS
jgi:hypothetical protein